ncbi:MAG: DUF5990 family protein [Acidimicrobiia bacterium]|nr:DUF5990 family protein [Acidimicrobiia bacterium]
MTTSDTESFALRIIALDPPFSKGDQVLFGMQRRALVEETRPATATTHFDVQVTVSRQADGTTHFAGPYVHGKRGDRFLYLAWGLSDTTEPFAMFARTKIKLAHIPIDLLDDVQTPGACLLCELNATNDQGQPATGTVQPPNVSWSRMR